MRKYQKDWMAEFRNKGHIPQLNEDNEIDMFVCDSEFHNGPGCQICKYAPCMWCTSIQNILKCE